jgi:hypothetical protein
MNCKEVRQTFSLYVDNQLTEAERKRVNDHLAACPVCRDELVQMKSVVRGLGAIERPRVPVDLAASISRTLKIEAAAMRQQPQLALSEIIWRWIQPRIMPYTIGTFASLLFFSLMFMGLRSSLMAFRSMDPMAGQTRQTYRVILNTGAVIEYDLWEPITPEGVAAERKNFSMDSPSIDPQGALASLTARYMNDNGDDDMVVVTDVFSNGIASLADVIEPPRDPRMLDAFQNALRKNPAFVPAATDKRPQSIRVVFVVQKVAVSEDSY